MYTHFDYEEERQGEEERVAKFFGDFTSEVRNRLMSKNLVKPQSLYDIFYPSVKNQMLSKNENYFKSDIEEISKEIRDSQLAKAVEKQFSIEEQSDEFRKSLLARNKIHEEKENLLSLFENKRKELVGKNNDISEDLLIASSFAREKNVSKNTTVQDVEIAERQDRFRVENLSRNFSKEIDLTDASSEYRKDELSRNSTLESNLKELSNKFRKSDLSTNSEKIIDLEKDSFPYRNLNVSKNNTQVTDVETYSKDFREHNLSSNSFKGFDLKNDSETFRKKNLSSNDLKENDLLSDSNAARTNNLSNNIESNVDLLSNSLSYRDGELIRNNSNEIDLLKNSGDFRNTLLSKNVHVENSLESDSASFRNNELALNKENKVDLVESSKGFKDSNLSNNQLKESSLLEDSKIYQKNNLSLKRENPTDIEKYSESARNSNLSNNSSANGDLQKDSILYLKKNISNNIPSNSDLLKSSSIYHDTNLSNNSVDNGDLLTDSTPYLNQNTSANVPGGGDLLTDSTPYLNQNTSTNVPDGGDLLTDSTPYLNQNTSANVPDGGDLLTDSTPYLNQNTSANVPDGGDLLTDSTPYYNQNTSANVPDGGDLLTDSTPYLNQNTSANVPDGGDLLTDSTPYYNQNTSANVPDGGDLLTDSTPYYNQNLSSNVPGSQSINSHINQYGQSSSPVHEKDLNLSKNVSNAQTIDKHIDRYGSTNGAESERESNLSKNVGFGMLGFNILGPGGTSLFVGESGVWAQGIVFRNLLTIRNKYMAPADYYTENRNLEYGIGGRLLADTLKVPMLGNVINQEALPINTSDIINSRVERYQNVISPIERNLMRATDEALTSKTVLAPYYIYDSKGTFSYSVDYSLNNLNIIGKSFDYKINSEVGAKLPKDNFNNLMRQYLKYSNFSMLRDEDGMLKTEAPDRNISAIAEQIRTISLSSDYTKTIQELIIHYNMFDKDRMTRISNSSKSILTNQGVQYLDSDVETMFDHTRYNGESKSIAAQTAIGNPYSKPDNGFNSSTPTKGVRKILRDISSDANVESAINFKDIQGVTGEVSKTYVLGTYDKRTKEPKKGYQKYTIKNPYAPVGAGSLVFSLKNYSIPETMGNTMYFPPYINSFQNSDSANWNATNFLGRPEAVYTYNNSSRDGSISFFVLTDYAETVLLGKSQDKNMSEITIDINKNFTSMPSKSDPSSEDVKRELEAKQKDADKMSQERELNSRQQNSGSVDVVAKIPETESEYVQFQKDAEASTGVKGDANSNKTADSFKGLSNKTADAVNNIVKNTISNNDNVYTEGKKGSYNVYNSVSDPGTNLDGGFDDSGVADTKERITSMIAGIPMMFQPAFLSGSKVDFKRRMEFLSKLTRPASNASGVKKNSETGKWEGGSGFSFTKPPVCHIRLGDWFNHDIIINSVSYDYSDAPWTTNLDAGRVQPMWANVTINFNIVGPAGDSGGVPLTSTDAEGYYA